MTDYTELQKAAAYAAQDTIKFADEDEEMRALQQFHEEVDPETVLALIAENERLRADCSSMRGSLKANAVSIKKLIKDGGRAARERDQLKAENVALLSTLKGMTSMYGHCWDLVDGGLLCMQDNVQRFEDAHEAAQKVIAAMGQGEQS